LLLILGLMTIRAPNTMAQTIGGALPAGNIQLQSPPWLANPFN
jgi:hypothetical protein